MTDHRSACPIASTLDIVGDKWTLVIVRDMLNGKSRYGELLDGPERIATTVLGDRLRRMEEAGLVRKRLYQERPKRYAYELTEMGRALHPVLQEMCRFANVHLPGTWAAPEHFMRPIGRGED
ncbi:winged helix-turn-helix transcriptional regulator [Pontivivens ytuae]|uniref:Helix-turn-helix transcriptional regulator n=1 Tax=Pontivivens ytuae TaxID=2789856 RepID=A0A7S9QC12_9RHOB|nr:helix-turn-helix domain-containing protein [Pontivivens ytuae]QPH52596.1 helix-turn-helix transcriptional regulator [Pontivivens ytuae]